MVGSYFSTKIPEHNSIRPELGVGWVGHTLNELHRLSATSDRGRGKLANSESVISDHGPSSYQSAFADTTWAENHDLVLTHGADGVRVETCGGRRSVSHRVRPEWPRCGRTCWCGCVGRSRGAHRWLSSVGGGRPALNCWQCWHCCHRSWLLSVSLSVSPELCQWLFRRWLM